MNPMDCLCISEYFLYFLLCRQCISQFMFRYVIYMILNVFCDPYIIIVVVSSCPYHKQDGVGPTYFFFPLTSISRHPFFFTVLLFITISYAIHPCLIRPSTIYVPSIYTFILYIYILYFLYSILMLK